MLAVDRAHPDDVGAGGVPEPPPLPAGGGSPSAPAGYATRQGAGLERLCVRRRRGADTASSVRRTSVATRRRRLTSRPRWAQRWPFPTGPSLIPGSPAGTRSQLRCRATWRAPQPGGAHRWDALGAASSGQGQYPAPLRTTGRRTLQRRITLTTSGLQMRAPNAASRAPGQRHGGPR